MDSSNPDPGVLASLGWIDLTALSVLLVFFVLGLFRGFVWQIGRVATLVVAYFVAMTYGEDVAGRIQQAFPEGVHPRLPLYIAWVGVFIVVLVVVSIVSHFLEKLVHVTGLSFYNRFGGGLLGIGTGACVVLAMLAAILMFLASESQIVNAAQSSRTMQVSKQTISILGDIVPDPVQELFGIEPGSGDSEENQGK